MVKEMLFIKLIKAFLVQDHILMKKNKTKNYYIPLHPQLLENRQEIFVKQQVLLDQDNMHQKF